MVMCEASTDRSVFVAAAVVAAAGFAVVAEVPGLAVSATTFVGLSEHC
jgi:hypothetical protein